MKPDELIVFLNEQHGTVFRVVGPLGGGYQEGAYRIAEPCGRVAVLKLTRAPRSVAVVRRLRQAGYPAPDFLFWGAAPDGTSYLVQEFLRGAPVAAFTPENTKQLIALNRLQSGLNPEPWRPDASWSDYAMGVVFADESGWASCLRAFSTETARLMAALEQAAAPFTDVRLPRDDAVHGDWSLGNLLSEQGQITGIVDCASAGYGTRAIDLSSLLHYAYDDEYDNTAGRAVRTLLRDEILAIGGTSMLVVLLIYRAMALVEFAARHHREARVVAHTQMGWKILGDFCAFSEVSLHGWPEATDP